MHGAIKELVRGLLVSPHGREWSIQGFGMLRTYLDDKKVYRLNVWDSNYRVKDVSLVHNHPWHFESLIVAGKLRNIRFDGARDGKLFKWAQILPGPGGGKLGPAGEARLEGRGLEVYGEGDTYQQKAHEIHISMPEDGTVTLNKRERVGEDRAVVYWDTPEWVDAEPRVATYKEIEDITRASINRWFH